MYTLTFIPYKFVIHVYHPDLVQSTHTHLAQELEGEGNHKNAEKHYIDAGDWKSAVHMYRGVDLWEDAYRSAGQHIIIPWI